MHILSPLPASCASVTPTCHEAARSSIERLPQDPHARGVSPAERDDEHVEATDAPKQPKCEQVHASQLSDVRKISSSRVHASPIIVEVTMQRGPNIVKTALQILTDRHIAPQHNR